MSVSAPDRASFSRQGSCRRIERPKVFLNHPKGNQINLKMREELFDAFEQIAASTARDVVMCREAIAVQAAISVSGRASLPTD